MNLRGIQRSAIIAAGITLIASSAWAATITFTTRSAFDLAAGATVLEDFEDTTAAAGGFSVENAPMSSTTSGAAYALGAIIPGLTIADRPGPNTGALLLGGTGLFAGSTKNVGANTFADSLDLMFSPGVFGAGFDFLGAAAPGALTSSNAVISVFDALNNTLFSGSVAFSGVSTFFGVTSDVAIGRINIFAINNSAEFADNIALASGTRAVPEPATMLLLGGGLAAAAVSRRYRRRS